MTREELMTLAGRCIDGEVGVYEFAESVAEARGIQTVEAMFGPCADRQTARTCLKQALRAATDEDAAAAMRRGHDWTR